MPMSTIHPQAEVLVFPLQNYSNHPNIFMIEPIQPLHQVNANITLLSVLLGRKDDHMFNNKIVTLAVRASPFLLFIFTIFTLGVLPICFLVDNPTWWTIGSISSFIIIFPCCILVGGTVSYDVFCLLTKTFEFRYLSMLIWVNEIIWVILYRNPARFLCTFLSTCALQISINADATLHMRPFLARCMVLGSSVAPLVAFGVKTGITSGQRKTTYTILGRELDLADAFVNNVLVTVWLLGGNALSMVRLVLPNSKVDSVVCEMYHPVSHLVRVKRRSITALPALTSKNTCRGLELLSTDKHRYIDEYKQLVCPTLLKKFSRYTKTLIHQSTGWIGITAWAFALLWHLLQAHQTSNIPLLQLVLAIIGLVSTMIYCGVSAAHYQSTLFSRIIRQPDAWFVSFQFTMFTLAACDMFAWNYRSLLVLPPWLWCHWTLFLDALTPLSRQSLHYQRCQAIIVQVLLVLYPFIISYWIYFSHTADITNRVFSIVLYYGVKVQASVFSFLASQMINIWIWMSRFLWRELYQPEHSLKFIKQQVRYSGGLKTTIFVRPVAPKQL